MPSKKQYNLVHNDDYDTRIPLHSDEAFHRGIIFHAKFIGSLEVPRPTSRVEIVAAMRRIRYEFKAKGIKKKKVTLEVSVDGLKVTLRKKKKQHWMDENKIFLMHHPIYRIFYVSHDSHDLKIFSYIARDGNSNSFKCNVFKSSKKSQAMRVVRTVGQAFEVCHKLSLNSAPEDREREANREGGRDPLHHDDDYEDQDDTASQRPPPTPPPVLKEISLLTPAMDGGDSTPEITASCLLRSHEPPVTTASTTPIRQSPSATMTSDCGMLAGGELTALKHEIQLLRERLEQQGQQTRAAVAHARLLQDQLAAETAARVEAQTRTHQLLVQNKELLEHIGALVGHLREQERSGSGHVTTAPQGPPGPPMSATTTVPDLSTLGQPSQRAGAPSSPWELEPPSFAFYSYPPDSVYTPTPGNVLGSQGLNASNDQLHFQAQLLERLHNLAPYQSQAQQRSPYATPSPYPMGTGLLLPPTSNNRSSGSAQASPISTSLRVSQPNSFSPSPVTPHGTENYNTSSSLESNSEDQQQQHQQQQQHHHRAAFIKPLPQGQMTHSVQSLLAGDIDSPRLRTNHVDDVPPVVLDPPPQGRRSAGIDNRGNDPPPTTSDKNSYVGTLRAKKNHPDTGGRGNTAAVRPNDGQKHLVHFLGASGPPPSRTTSARLPSRSELMTEVQRTTWARHTTK
ncbi:carboxyl-terminal PDZ ligand of neuronal nitric oxide synthase protein isoform X2 [Athalia rosae]|uniref:carboxyl-terminal PDZ ligand of neuronal nitric oxide synthase protein isoform X2 n=1 Tax=Athalia rosae TaxID=37344 RepID=UPI00203441AE|nr:carboxyl-terminal PDZ ligand of neuronal nitric oxide synthase protein isoform X2 [Athalia rosae]